jgi:hypothetical protein
VRLASHPEEIKKREETLAPQKPGKKESHPGERNGFLKLITFWKK